MTPPPKSDANHPGHWVFPAVKTKLPDGRWLIAPGEPQLRVRTAEAVRMTGLSSKTLHRLADAGFVRRVTMSAHIVFWWPGEIEAMIERAASDDGFARRVCAFADCERSEIAGRG